MLGDWVTWNLHEVMDVLRALFCSLGSEQMKGTVARQQRPRNSGVSFVLWACEDYNSTLKVKGMLPGRPWYFTECSPIGLVFAWNKHWARCGIQGWRRCGLGPWWPLFFQYLLNICDLPNPALRRLGRSICTIPPSYVHSVSVILCRCFS